MNLTEQLKGLLESVNITSDDADVVIETFDEVINESQKANEQLKAELELKDGVIAALREYIGNTTNKKQPHVVKLLEASMNANKVIEAERDELLEYTQQAVEDIRNHYETDIIEIRHARGSQLLVEGFVESMLAFKPELVQNKIAKLEQKLTEQAEQLEVAQSLLEKTMTTAKKDELTSIIESTLNESNISAVKKSKIRVLAKRAGIDDPKELKSFILEAIDSINVSANVTADHIGLTENINGPAQHKTIRSNDKYVNMLIGK